MKRTSCENNFIPKQSDFKDWESVFAKAMDINVGTLKTGTIVSSISRILNLENKNAAQLKDGVAKMPVLAHLIRHNKFGDYLIDTGFDSSFAKRAGGNFKGVFRSIAFKNRYIQENSSEGIEIQLKERRVSLNGVFLTHIHEHASGAPSLPDDIPYVFGNGEQEAGIFPIIYSNFFQNKSNLQKINFSTGHEMPMLGKCVDIFGDGSFWAFHTPGHTKGHISYIINGAEIKALITGDACITKKGFELGVETGKNSENMEEGRVSFLKIKEFVKKYPEVKVIFGHESDIFSIEYQ